MDVAGLPGRLAAREARGRAMAEARMQSRCTLWRRDVDENGAPAFTRDADGYEVESWSSPAVDLPIRLTRSDSSREVTIGGVTYEQAIARGDIPAGTRDVKDGDLVEITAGEWPGAWFRVIEAVRADQRTARRLPLQQAEPPEVLA